MPHTHFISSFLETDVYKAFMSLNLQSDYKDMLCNSRVLQKRSLKQLYANEEKVVKDLLLRHHKVDLPVKRECCYKLSGFHDHPISTRLRTSFKVLLFLKFRFRFQSRLSGPFSITRFEPSMYCELSVEINLDVMPTLLL